MPNVKIYTTLLIACFWFISAQAADITGEGVITETIYDEHGNPLGTKIGTITIGFDVYDREAYKKAMEKAATKTDEIDMDYVLCRRYLARLSRTMTSKVSLERAKVACANVAQRQSFGLNPLGKIAATDSE
ncbi:hypothetical protein OAS86_02255 [Gammaproteobacteria bacterium]|nr:hypothetical protein [Gammaproteobacteria bacterium]